MIVIRNYHMICTISSICQSASRPVCVHHQFPNYHQPCFPPEPYSTCSLSDLIISYVNKRYQIIIIKKPSSIALSTIEAEYLAAASCYTQLLWMMQTLQDIQITCTPPISILCDNTSAISVSKNPVMHSKTKHIPIKYHFL